MNTFFFLDIQLLEVNHAEIVYNIDNQLIQFKELLWEKISRIHLITDNCSARRRFADLIKEFFIDYFVAFCQNIDMR